MPHTPKGVGREGERESRTATARETERKRKTEEEGDGDARGGRRAGHAGCCSDASEERERERLESID